MQSARALAAITVVLREPEPIAAKVMTGKEAQEFVVRQGRDDFFTVTFTRRKAGRTAARNLAEDGCERQQLIIEVVMGR